MALSFESWRIPGSAKRICWSVIIHHRILKPNHNFTKGRPGLLSIEVIIEITLLVCFKTCVQITVRRNKAYSYMNSFASDIEPQNHSKTLMQLNKFWLQLKLGSSLKLSYQSLPSYINLGSRINSFPNNTYIFYKAKTLDGDCNW